MTLDVLSPFRTVQPQNRGLQTPNNQSIVLKLNHGDVCVLLSGDAEREAEDMIVSAGYLLECDVVKVGHHGSSSSSSWPFVKAVSAGRAGDRRAIITVGRNNRFGHPDDEIMARWRSFGWSISRTDHGAQWITSDGNTVSLKHWR